MATGSASRMPTGIPGCDEILVGGLMPRRSVMLAGSAGCGETGFTLQWLLAGRARGDSMMYVTLCEPGGEIRRNVAGFDWSLDGIEIVDLSPPGRELGDDPGEYPIFPPSEVESTPVWRAIYQTVQAARPQRLVIDSATQLRYLATDEYQFRKNVIALINFLDGLGITSMLAYEPGEMPRDTSEALAVGGVIRLQFEMSAGLAAGCAASRSRSCAARISCREFIQCGSGATGLPCFRTGSSMPAPPCRAKECSPRASRNSTNCSAAASNPAPPCS